MKWNMMSGNQIKELLSVAGRPGDRATRSRYSLVQIRVERQFKSAYRIGKPQAADTKSIGMP